MQQVGSLGHGFSRGNEFIGDELIEDELIEDEFFGDELLKEI